MVAPDFRSIYLVICRPVSRQRGHFGIFIPSTSDSLKGTEIHDGAPMIGFVLEFKRNYIPSSDETAKIVVPLGETSSANVMDYPRRPLIREDIPRDTLEHVATQVLPPRARENLLAPVNDTTNRRCQEWTIDFLRRLVAMRYIEESAVQIAQSYRDPPDFGIGLKLMGEG